MAGVDSDRGGGVRDRGGCAKKVLGRYLMAAGYVLFTFETVWTIIVKNREYRLKNDVKFGKKSYAKHSIARGNQCNWNDIYHKFANCQHLSAAAVWDMSLYLRKRKSRGRGVRLCKRNGNSAVTVSGFWQDYFFKGARTAQRTCFVFVDAIRELLFYKMGCKCHILLI